MRVDVALGTKLHIFKFILMGNLTETKDRKMLNIGCYNRSDIEARTKNNIEILNGKKLDVKKSIISVHLSKL